MTRLSMYTPDKASKLVEELYKEIENRIAASPPGLCPVDLSLQFLRLCHAQTCGKCVPCRVGLKKLAELIEDVLDGKADLSYIELIEKTAQSIVDSADCAIGFEAARMILKGLVGFREDYIEHITNNRCVSTLNLPVPCVSLCPAHVDIPGYIALVGEERYADAIRLIRKDNPFPTTCAHICEHPCEMRCRRNMKDTSLNIRGLKKMAADHAGIVEPPKCAESTGKKVAVIGGGPGGLSAAYFLQLMGHQVTVYEMHERLGGMLMYGIPNYRLPKERLQEDIDAILATGVEVIHGKRIGTDITLDEIYQQYDATLVTIGASTDKKLGIEGEDANGVISAVQLLRNVGYGQEIDYTGKKVCVIGGGNVAMDAVRTSIRLGAEKTSIVYRRRRLDMTALPAEIEGAIAEGAELLGLKAPLRIEKDENNNVCGLWVQPQMISKITNGRASVKATVDKPYMIDADIIIVAIGQQIESEPFAKFGLPVERGIIKSDATTAFKAMPGMFAGGDCATGPSTVIRAIAAGKVSAANIDEYLGYHHEIQVDVEIPPINLTNREKTGRVELPEREANERKHDFKGCEGCMSKKEAKQEASKCLRCDHFGYGIFKGGRESLW
ncbi:MAG: NAD(P)-binding protein [Bacillota bacterium]|nr:NAD(P)-binding protein [Bacillota bacterium]